MIMWESAPSLDLTDALPTGCRSDRTVEPTPVQIASRGKAHHRDATDGVAERN